MSNPIIRAQITFAHAARAAGLTEKTLRNWLDRGQVILTGDEEREGASWRRFSLLDVVRLACVGRLASYGFSVRDAAVMVDDLIADRLSLLRRYRNTPPNAIAAALHGTTIALSHNAGGYSVSRSVFPDSPADVSNMSHYVFLDLGQIATDTLAALDRDDEGQA